MVEKYKELPSQEELRRRIYYDPETGLITRLTVGHNFNVPQSFGEQISIGGIRYITARVIWKYMTGEDPATIVDHENRDGSDHRWKNLRLATRSQNNSNTNLRRDNKTGVKGVYPYQWDKTRWIAHIRKDGKGIRSPIFNTMEEAIQWRLDKELEYQGEFRGV